MALATATISYDLADLTGVDFDYRRTKVWTTTNIDDQTVIDTEGNAIRLGSGNGSVASDGTGSVEVWIPGAGSNPASWQTYIHVDYPDRNAAKGRGRRTFGPFTITVSANLADLVTEMEVPPETLGGDAWLATIDADDTSQYRVQQDARLTATYAGVGDVGTGLSRVLTKLQTGEDITVSLIGDSGLEGTTATAGNDFASEVKATLEAAFDGTVTVNNRAVSGYRAYSPLNPGEASPTKFSEALDDAADLYVISFGHNDIRSQGVFGAAYNPGTGYPSAASIASVEHMIRRLRVEQPDADIALSNEWHYTGASVASNTVLEPYNNALRRLAATYGCAFIDFWQALADAGVTGSTPATDDLYIHPSGGSAQHPNDAGHALWAATLTDQLGATARVVPESPSLPALALHGAERHTHAGWVAMPAAAGGVRTYGTDGYRLTGSWAGSATLPLTTTTVNDAIDVQFIGTECVIRLDGGAGQGHVKIVIDGVNYNSDLDLAPIGTGQHRLPITGLAQGVHRIVVTVLSGSVTFRGVEYLPAHVRSFKYDSALITYTGAWSALGADAQYYDGNTWHTSTNGNSFTVSFIGTGIGVNMLGYGSTTHGVTVAVDGAAAVAEAWGVTNQTGNQAHWRTIVSGLPYGRHTVTVTLNQVSRFLAVSRFVVFDEQRTLRPTSFAGLAVTGAAITHPQALPSIPAVTITPDDATSTVPGYPSANTTAALTVGGTASARHSYRAEVARIAY